MIETINLPNNFTALKNPLTTAAQYDAAKLQNIPLVITEEETNEKKIFRHFLKYDEKEYFEYEANSQAFAKIPNDEQKNAMRPDLKFWERLIEKTSGYDLSNAEVKKQFPNDCAAAVAALLHFESVAPIVSNKSLDERKYNPLKPAVYQFNVMHGGALMRVSLSFKKQNLEVYRDKLQEIIFESENIAKDTHGIGLELLTGSAGYIGEIPAFHLVGGVVHHLTFENVKTAISINCRLSAGGKKAK